MTNPKTRQTDPHPGEEEPSKLAAEDTDESTQMIEEAAYYIGLNRERNSHAGDPMNDWLQAEKTMQEDLD